MQPETVGTSVIVETPTMSPPGKIYELHPRALALASIAPDHTTPEEARNSLSNLYTSAQWTYDGTTVLVTSSDRYVSSFALPDDLLAYDVATDGVRQLTPTSTTKLPEPTQVLAPQPFASYGGTDLYLVGCRDHPIQLYPVHATPHSAPSANFKLIKSETEEYITPSSIIWPSPGTHFVCGSANRLDFFDLTRNGSDGPVSTMATIPSKRHISKGSGVGMRGTVAALSSTQPGVHGAGVIAAGTWTRWIGLYDMHRTDRAIANWCIAAPDKAHFGVNFGGQGIVQTLWSPCGRYLVVNERHSNGLLVYDIRGTSTLLGVLGGRATNSQQKMTCDVFGGGDGENTKFEVWAGSQDGSVLVWDNVGAAAGITDASQRWNAHDAPIGSTAMHPSGAVAATCAGGWCHADSDATNAGPGQSYETKVMGESSLKVWSIDSAKPVET